MTIKTARDFYTAVANLTGIDTAIIDYATAAIAALDTKNAKRKTAPSAVKAAAERDAFRASVLAIFTADATLVATAADVGANLGVSTPKASAALTALANAGSLTKTEIKVKGKGKVNGYRLATDKGAE